MTGMTQRSSWKLGIGVVLAVTVAILLNTVPVRAETCCTPCSCINLCCSSDGCSSGGAECNSGGCTTYCGGAQFEYWCLHYCQHT